MEKKFKESLIPELYSKALSKESMIIGPSVVPKVANVIFTGVSKLLQKAYAGKPTAVRFRSVNNNFICAAKVEFIPNGEDPSNGRWDYVWTFNEEDLNGAEIIDAETNSHVNTEIVAAGSDLYNMRFAPGVAIIMSIILLEQISDWLQENTLENEPSKLVLDSVFTAIGELEDGKVYKSIIPAGEIKVLIKNDSAIQEH